MAIVPYSGFYGPNTGDYSLLVNKWPVRGRIKRVVNRDGFRAFTALFNALVGAAPGGTVTATHTRVGHRASDSSGGLVTGRANELGQPQIVTVTDINRVSTAADVAALKEMVFGVTARSSYPADRSGNGGPALS